MGKRTQAQILAAQTAQYLAVPVPGGAFGPPGAGAGSGGAGGPAGQRRRLMPAPHAHLLTETLHAARRICDVCNAPDLPTTRHCAACEYDECAACFARRRPGAGGSDDDDDADAGAGADALADAEDEGFAGGLRPLYALAGGTGEGAMVLVGSADEGARASVAAAFSAAGAGSFISIFLARSFFPHHVTPGDLSW